MNVSGDDAYLFRHAERRGGAYQVLPPSSRSRLHAFAEVREASHKADWRREFAAFLCNKAQQAADPGPRLADAAKLEAKADVLERRP